MIGNAGTRTTPSDTRKYWKSDGKGIQNVVVTSDAVIVGDTIVQLFSVSVDLA